MPCPTCSCLTSIPITSHPLLLGQPTLSSHKNAKFICISGPYTHSYCSGIYSNVICLENKSLIILSRMVFLLLPSIISSLLIFKCRNLCCSQNLISFLFCMINYDTWSVWFHKELRVMLDIFPNIGVNSIWLKGVYLRSEMGKAEFSKGFFSGLFSNICRVLKMWKWSRSVVSESLRTPWT